MCPYNYGVFGTKAEPQAFRYSIISVYQSETTHCREVEKC